MLRNVIVAVMVVLAVTAISTGVLASITCCLGSKLGASSRAGILLDQRMNAFALGNETGVLNPNARTLKILQLR